MLCHLYSFASFVMLCYPLVNSFTTIGSDIDFSADNRTQDYNQTDITKESYDFDNKFNVSAQSANETFDEDLSASSAQQLTWIRSADGKYVSVKPDPNRNSSHLLKQLLKVFNKNAETREDTDLGLPPDIAHEYIDAVNPPKFRIPVQFGKNYYISSSISPVVPVIRYENRLHAGSNLVKTKTNYTSGQKPSPTTVETTESSRNVDLATLLKAEFDAKKDELDQSNVNTPSPNLFALLPNGPKTDNPFIDSNYKSPNRVKTSTHRPYVTSANSVSSFHSDANNMGQFVYSDGLPSVRVNIPSNRPIFSITTPNSISLITTSSATKVLVMKSTTTSTTTTSTTTTTARPVQYTKLKIKTMGTSSTTTTIRPSTSSYSTTTTTTTRTSKTPKSSKTTKTPIVLMSTTIAYKNNNKQQNNSDWSSRVNNQTTDRLSESNDSINQITGPKESTANSESHEPYINENTILRSNKNKKIVSSEDYYSSTDKTTTNKTDYNEFDYADNSALNPNYTVPDGFADYPGANYRLTTERLAYILIGSCCALSILCLIVVAMSVRCRDMCDEYRSWKKAEKAALRWQRHQYRLAHHQQDLSRYFRTAVEPNPEANSRPTPNVMTAQGPLFGPTCCHCISCSSSWLFRDVNKAGREWCCQRGYYTGHPTPRGKLPFGAASSVNTFMPRYANNNTNNGNNCCDDHEGDTDSLNTSDLLETHHNNRTHNFGECNASNTRTEQTNRRQQLRRIAQPNGNQNWIHSSEIVDELHKKHSNINNISREQTNVNNFRARNRQIANENVVVWNNNNDERLI